MLAYVRTKSNLCLFYMFKKFNRPLQDKIITVTPLFWGEGGGKKIESMAVSKHSSLWIQPFYAPILVSQVVVLHV